MLKHVTAKVRLANQAAVRRAKKNMLPIKEKADDKHLFRLFTAGMITAPMVFVWSISPSKQSRSVPCHKPIEGEGYPYF
jgi:hypothetical protein